MKKNKFLLVFLLTACASPSFRGAPDLSVKAFDAVQRGMDAKQVVELLGQPTEIRKSEKFPDQDWWIYDDQDAVRSQRGTLLVDQKNKTVSSVTVIPKMTDPEEKLDYLLKTKFSSSVFEQNPLRQCSRDYIPSQVFYIDVKNGILIIANQNTGEVESFSKVSSRYTTKLAQDIKSCRR